MIFTQFLEEFGKLKLLYPVLPSHNSRSENCDFGDYQFNCVNGYYSFDNAQCKDTVYIFDSFKAVNCVDGDYVIESENCYQCVDVLKAYNCTYMNYCGNIYDSHFCWDSGNSHHLFGCVHLQHKEYCIYNKQYSEEEYQKKVKELLQRSPDENLREMKEMAEKFPITSTYVANSENSDYGNHVDFCKNMYLCFDSAHCENSAYLYDAHHNKNCYDLTQNFHSEFCYECVNSSRLNNCFFMDNCDDTFDSGFCLNCSSSNHLLGCVALDKKEYCILNKQYSQEDYGKLAKEIMDSMNGKNSEKIF
ncbi:MAG: hypothetical protein UT63_C0044G0005 [Candidatus Gottesmanbacteria bacterium GW2011_GWC2_39_8]|uniref:Uncharacterized protein n=1 Tax=Candidatus Gottesmanbacteria bacterium GW2011_GWC2_39_8 TaxID=1618450 RepID=A0A0G0PWY7_9BACT|nr:MAG: hypothetical protein UT63_C0044G0005 [Candidatus Gottesmanbacteria bacterium GW2011_GWC2_39_8]